MTRRHHAFWPGLSVVIGLCLVSFYGYARENRIGNIGAEGDIGGGLIPLLVLILSGTVVAACRGMRHAARARRDRA